MQWQIEPIPAWRWEKHRQEPHRFSASYADTVDLLTRELVALGAKGTIAVQLVCTEDDVRRDGMLRANARPSYPGVAISFQSKFGPLTYPCDTYQGSSSLPGWQANLRAIALSLKGLRDADRHKVARRGEQYVGWRAIGTGKVEFESADAAARWLRDLVDIPGAEGLSDKLLIRTARSISHPDKHGGDRSLWNRVEDARDLLERGGAQL
jgi:hypothetical protein